LKVGVVGTLNGYVVGDAKVQNSVTVDGAASVADGDSQEPTDGSAVGMKKESSVATDG
jgi:hypothetical protein